MYNTLHLSDSKCNTFVYFSRFGPTFQRHYFCEFSYNSNFTMYTAEIKFLFIGGVLVCYTTAIDKDSCQLFWKSSVPALFRFEKSWSRSLLRRADRSLYKSWFGDRPELPLKTQPKAFIFVCVIYN